METELRELLREKAEEIRIDHRVPGRMLRRARRRRVVSAVVAGGLAAGLVAGGVIGIRAAIPDRSAGFANPRTVQPWRGIWPQDTRAEAETAQAAADAGDPDATWQRNPVEVLERFGLQGLNWERVFASDLLGSRRSGRLTVRIRDCQTRWPAPCPNDVGLMLEQLLRRGDRSGIWFITAVQTFEPPKPGATPQPAPGT